METKHPRPDYVLAYEKEPGTEIKYINGHWYLYKRSSVYDPDKKRKRKKSGESLGTITPDGLKPSQRRRKKSGPAISSEENMSADTLPSAAASADHIPCPLACETPDSSPVHNCADTSVIAESSPAVLGKFRCVEYGASSFLYQHNQAMIERLKVFFPYTWKKIFTMAALKCMGEPSLKRMPSAYEASWFSVLFDDLRFSTGGLSKDLHELGMNREAVCQYMRSTMAGFSGFILIDGHRIITNSRNLPYAQLGYDSRMRYQPQVNLLYLFGNDFHGRMPLYYKQFAGSVPDCMTLPDISDEAGIAGSEITVIADKGFGSEDDFSFIIDSGMKYIIPLRRNTTEIRDDSGDKPIYDKVFNFRENCIYCKEFRKDGYNVYLYYDMFLALCETKDTVERLQKKNISNEKELEKESARRKKGKSKLTEEQIANMQSIDIASAAWDTPGIGIFILRTNRLDLNEAQVYALYKTRQEIEQNFKCYDDTLEMDASYMQNPESFEGWLFINHLALQMLYGVLDYIAQAGLTNRYSFDDLIKNLQAVRANQDGKVWRTTKHTKYTKKLCEDLGVTIEDFPVPHREP